MVKNILIFSPFYILSSLSGSPQDDERAEVQPKINTSSEKDKISPARNELLDISKRTGKNTAELKHEIAEGLIASRNDLIKSTGGYRPGYHIVDNSEIDSHFPEAALPPVNPSQIQTLDSRGFKEFSLFHTNGSGPKIISSRYSNYADAFYVDPVDVSKSLLGRGVFVGYVNGGTLLTGPDIAETPELKALKTTPNGRTGWTTITRYFSAVPFLGDVILEESEPAAAGRVVLVPANIINTRVGRYRASLVRFKDADGNGMSILTWADESGKMYEIKVNKINEVAVGHLLSIARSMNAVDE